MFGQVDKRLRQAFPHHGDEVLGGCSCLLFGDFGQLPPVMDLQEEASKNTSRSEYFQENSDFWSITDSIPSFCLNSVTRLRLLAHARVCKYSNTSAP